MESQGSENNGQSSSTASAVRLILSQSDVPITTTRRKSAQKNTGNVSWDVHCLRIIQIQIDSKIGALHEKNFHLAFHTFFVGQNQIGGAPTEKIWVPKQCTFAWIEMKREFCSTGDSKRSHITVGSRCGFGSVPDISRSQIPN